MNLHNHCFCKTVFVNDGFGNNIRHKECCVCGDRKVEQVQIPELKGDYTENPGNKDFND